MTKVFLKYNPYKVETEIKINGKPLKESSELRRKSRSGIRLQEWVDEFPQLLVQETNDKNFYLEFHGTDPDLEDLSEVLERAHQKAEIEGVKINPIPVKEVKDQEAEIEKIFQLVKKGPFPELCSQEINEAFQKAQSKNFEMCVVALMSAGKSTLINALLGEKLMPSSQQACTATITKIKDNDQPEWKYTAYTENPDGMLRQMGTPNAPLTFEIMQQLNQNENVAEIDITGNIPFVSSKEISLVITDTPGSNNAQNRHHGEVQKNYLNKNSKSLVLYLTEPSSFETDSDDDLLRRVAENMASAGKQARDRFIFVLNKMDGRNEEDGEVSKTLDHARKFFKKHGIDNPNLFPVSALSALNIRLAQNGLIDKNHIKATISQVDKLMLESGEYFFEQYAPLPESLKGEISKQLEKAKRETKSADEKFLETEAIEIYNDRRTALAYVDLKKNGEEALIHSGIVSLEMAIRQYLEKYARPAKIYDLANVFMKKLEALGCMEELNQEMTRNQGNRDRILCQIQLAEKKLNDIRSAKQFENRIEETVKKVRSDAVKKINSYKKIYEGEVSKKTLECRAKKLSVEEAMELVDELGKFLENLLQKSRTDLDEIIRETLYQTCESLVNEYKQKLSSVADEINSSFSSGISFNPLTLMSASIPEINIEEIICEERVKIGEEWVSNTHKKWYKPWTWFEARGWLKAVFKKVEYVQSDELLQKFSTIQKTMLEDRITVLNYIAEESDRVSKAFIQEFHMLDNELNKKMDSLKKFASERDKAEKRLKETQEKLDWIKDIESRMNRILEI